MSRYVQKENFLICGPGLPPEGVVSVGVDALEAAWQAGRKSALEPSDKKPGQEKQP